MAGKRPWMADQQLEVMLGVAATIGGALLLWDAHERRGRARPFLLKFVPSP